MFWQGILSTKFFKFRIQGVGMLLAVASLILILIAVVHSYLGEKYILIRWFKRENISHLLGGEHLPRTLC